MKNHSIINLFRDKNQKKNNDYKNQKFFEEKIFHLKKNEKKLYEGIN